ncbi:MAG TPA: dipeptidase PepE [Gemmatimonadaceae bacterium]|nr:dipeptidase PepE [Gemmatimonadaceae bacterium]
MGYAITSIHAAADQLAALYGAEAIVIGGGNTFRLLSQLYERGLLQAIQDRVRAGMPYIGWSAGSVLACPTIRTTNDMPIVQPPSLEALGLVPFQINAHYTDAHPPGFQGETRAERIAEFLELNPEQVVVGLPEGSMLQVEQNSVALHGDAGARLFVHGTPPRQVALGESLDFLLTR